MLGSPLLKVLAKVMSVKIFFNKSDQLYLQLENEACSVVCKSEMPI